MRISTEKTVILLGLRGKAAYRLLRQYVLHDAKRGKLFLVPGETVKAPPVARLPIVLHHTYLGVKISYQQFEMYTLKHRLQQSWSAFRRLQPALRSSSLTLRQRL